MVTVITMYRGDDAEMFTQVVDGSLTSEERQKWRDAHNCDQPGDDEMEDRSNMFFREFDKPLSAGKTSDLHDVDGEGKEPTVNE